MEEVLDEERRNDHGQLAGPRWHDIHQGGALEGFEDVPADQPRRGVDLDDAGPRQGLECFALFAGDRVQVVLHQSDELGVPQLAAHVPGAVEAGKTSGALSGIDDRGGDTGKTARLGKDPADQLTGSSAAQKRLDEPLDLLETERPELDGQRGLRRGGRRRERSGRVRQAGDRQRHPQFVACGGDDTPAGVIEMIEVIDQHRELPQFGTFAKHGHQSPQGWRSPSVARRLRCREAEGGQRKLA